jgi:hypothetical protein
VLGRSSPNLANSIDILTQASERKNCLAEAVLLQMEAL